MRALLAIGCAACAGSAKAPTAAPRARADGDARAIAACDFERWREGAESKERGWLLGSAGAVTLLDARGSEVRVAHATHDVIVARWVPYASLAPVVALAAPVSPSAGGPPDPAVLVLPGLRVAGERSGDWFAVAPDPDEGLAFAGYVPRSAVGTRWTVLAPPAPPPTSRAFRLAGAIRAAPKIDAPVRATVAESAVTFTGPAPGTPYEERWVQVTAVTAGASVSGYLQIPPPKPRKLGGHELELDDNLVDGELPPHPTLVSGACLYDAPGGAVVGAILSRYEGAIAAARAGWSRIVVATPWGDQALYTNAEVLPPAEPWTWPEGIVD